VTHPPPTGTVVEDLRIGYCVLKRETQTKPDKSSLKQTNPRKTKQNKSNLNKREWAWTELG